MSFIGGGGILRGMSREGISWYPILFPQAYYLLNLGLQYALNVFIFSPLVFCAYFCIWEGAGRKAKFQGAQYILLSPPIDQYLQYFQSYSVRPA